jgi:SAM-dependent methyltransferase
MSQYNDYGPIAHLYDTYVSVDFDIPFFATHASKLSGPVLELMAGTGRVSQDLLRANPHLTCVDISAEMLQVLKQKTAGFVPAPQIVCADVRSLPLECRYELALIPFNSFAELTAVGDQQRTLAEVWRVLIEGGRLICTLHNPAVRARTLDGQPRLLGTFELAGDDRLELWVKGWLDPETGLAFSQQTYRIFGTSSEQVDERWQEVCFALIGKDEFESMARDAGFSILNLAGDYEGAEYHDESPFLIWTLAKLC